MSLSKARSRLLQRLQHRNQRGREGCFVVEGIRAAVAALEVGVKIRFAVTSPRLVTLDRDNRLGEGLSAARFEVVVVDDSDFGALTNTVAPQGILLVCDTPTATLDSLLADDEEAEPAAADNGNGILVADAIQDPTNLASMIRTGAAFGLEGLIALDGTVDPWNAKVVRGSVGGCFRMEIVSATVEEFLDWVRNRRVTLLAAEASGRDIAAASFSAPWALVVGNEGAGIRAELRDAAHASVGVPIRAHAESLNAGVAAAILCYELSRAPLQRRPPPV